MQKQASTPLQPNEANEAATPIDEVTSPSAEENVVTSLIANEQNNNALAGEEEKSNAPVDAPAMAAAVTPLPWKKIIIVFIIHIADVFAMTTLMPYIGTFHFALFTVYNFLTFFLFFPYFFFYNF